MAYSVKLQDFELNNADGVAVTSGVMECRERSISKLQSPRGEVVELGGEANPTLRIQGCIYGANADANLAKLLSFKEKNYPLYFKYGAREEWVVIEGIRYEEAEGSTADNKIYTYVLEMTSLGSLSKYKRCVVFNYEDLPDEFNIAGEFAVPLPVGASPALEAVDFHRVSSGGSIPVVHQPSMDVIAYTVSSQENLDLARPRAYWDGSSHKFMMENGLVRIVSRHGESSNPGGFNLYFYSGSSWSSMGLLSFHVNDINNSGWDSPDKPPSVIVACDDLLYKRIKIVYPSTAVKAYNLAVNMELWYGKPFLKMDVENYANGPTLKELKFRVSNVSLRYYTNNIDGTLDATAGTYGERTTAGGSDTKNIHYLHSGSPLASTTDIVGFARIRKTDSSYIANDAGSVWDRIELYYTNMTLTGEAPSHAAWLFLYRYGPGGSRSPEDVGKEILEELYMSEAISEVY